MSDVGLGSAEVEGVEDGHTNLHSRDECLWCSGVSLEYGFASARAGKTAVRIESFIFCLISVQDGLSAGADKPRAQVQRKSPIL